MGSRSRIRWHKVFKLGAGVFGCLALFLGLPSLIRRPEPPPLEPDIGLAHVAAPRVPASSGRRHARHERRAAKGRDPSREQRHLATARRPTSREGVPPATGSPAAGAPAPASDPVPVPVPAADTAPPPAPPAPPPTAPPPARAAAPPPAAQTEFGFER